MLSVLLCLLWIFVSLFLILIILLQRGKGGGLVGALGGAGGSSAFGTKAGDVFTRITIGVFGVYLLLAMIGVWMMKTKPQFVGAKSEKAAAAKDKEGQSKNITQDDPPQKNGSTGVMPAKDELPLPGENSTPASSKENTDKKETKDKGKDSSEASPKKADEPAPAIQAKDGKKAPVDPPKNDGKK